MGTFLKIAPQYSNVTFNSVEASTTISATSASFSTASGYFTGTFSGSFIGLPTSSNLTPFSVTASKGYLTYTNTSTLTIVNTGSTDNILSVQNSTGSAFTINNQGVAIMKVCTGSIPTPVLGGIYFDSYDMYIGIEDIAP
jgi:hypothetical protein